MLPRFDVFGLAVSATTRRGGEGERRRGRVLVPPPRRSSGEGRGGAFLEWVGYVGNRYGTLSSEIDRIRAEGCAPLLELETRALSRVKGECRRRDDFVTAPVEELERRLSERATESSGAIEKRTRSHERQLAQAEWFDHVVENDDRGEGGRGARKDRRTRTDIRTATMSRP